MLNGLKRINVTLAVSPAGSVYVVIVMMNRMHIVSFAKLLMSGLRYMKKMAGRFLLSEVDPKSRTVFLMS